MSEHPHPEFQLLLYEASTRTATITLNRPEKRNALSQKLVEELSQAFQRAQSDEKVKVIRLKAAGKAFCAGADLAYLQKLQDFSDEENLQDSQQLKALFQQIYQCPKPVVAQVQGAALAGGCGLVSVCDFVFSAPEALFGYTEVRIGFVPALVTTFLLRKLGGAAARELLLSGKLLSAEEARQKGLVQHVIQASELNAHTTSFINGLITSNSASAMQMTKETILQLENMPLEEGLEFAAQQNAKARQTDDCKSGIAAFLKKEKITW